MLVCTLDENKQTNKQTSLSYYYPLFRIHSFSQSVSQSFNQSISHLTNQSTNQLFHPSIVHSFYFYFLLFYRDLLVILGSMECQESEESLVKREEGGLLAVRVKMATW